MGKFEFGADSIIKFIEYLKQNSLIKLTKYVLVVAFWIILIVSAFNYREVFGWVYETATKIAIEDHDRLTDYRISISSDIDNILKDICNETGGTRAYILEFHNGTNNPTGLPFNYMNMTYEYTDVSRTYSGAASWTELLISRCPLVSKFYRSGLFVGSVDDVMEVDNKLAHKLISDDVKYMGAILLYGKTKPIGILGVSTGEDSNIPYETIESVLIKYSHKVIKLLDVESIELQN